MVVLFHYESMTKSPSVPESSSSPFRQLDESQLEQVTGGTGEILVPTEECPTCLSGTDPTVQSARYQSLLAGDL